jgi:hypothetical protein
VEVDRGRLPAAGAAAEESLRLWTAGDASPQEVARTELVLAEVRWRRGQRAEARALVARALARRVDSEDTRRELEAWQAAHP